MVPEGLRHGKEGRIRRRIRSAHDRDVGAVKVGTFQARKNCVKKTETEAF